MASRAIPQFMRLLAVLLVLGAAGLTAPSARAAECTQTDPIELHYCQIGGESVLGLPIGGQYPIGTVGRAQDYTYGTIYWSAATGAHHVGGAIRGRYGQLGGPLGPMGFPVGDETLAADGIGYFAEFQAGPIYWSPSTGAHESHGAVLGRWTALGRERGGLGYPVSDMLVAADGVGWDQSYQYGVVYWSPSTGAHESHGAVLGRWTALGRERGGLGYPVSDMLVAADGVGWDQSYQYGVVYWSPSTGAHESHGAVLGRWTALGRERGGLGYPVSDMLVAADGVGWDQSYQYGVDLLVAVDRGARVARGGPGRVDDAGP